MTDKADEFIAKVKRHLEPYRPSRDMRESIALGILLGRMDITAKEHDKITAYILTGTIPEETH